MKKSNPVRASLRTFFDEREWLNASFAKLTWAAEVDLRLKAQDAFIAAKKGMRRGHKTKAKVAHLSLGIEKRLRQEGFVQAMDDDWAFNFIFRYTLVLNNRMMNGDVDAPQAVLACTKLLLTCLENAFNDVPEPVKEAYRQLARQSRIWPGHFSAHPEDEKIEREMLKNLELGKHSEINFTGKWRNETVETKIALALYDMLRHQATHSRYKKIVPEDILDIVRNFPPLTKSNSEAWWVLIEPLFLQIYGKEFENHKDFVHYWKNASYKDDPKARALIRRDIKKQIKQALRSIAAKTSTVRKPIPIQDEKAKVKNQERALAHIPAKH